MAHTGLLVRDLMTAEVYTVRLSDDLIRVARAMVERAFRHVPVVDLGGRLAGLISQRDLLRHQLIQQDQPPEVERAVLASLAARDLMTTHLEVTHPDTPLEEAARTMFDHKIGCMPVTAHGQLVGILTEADFVRFFAEDPPPGSEDR